MKVINKTAILSFSLLFSMACSQQEKPQTITVKNNLDQERTSETVELNKAILKMEDLSNAGIRNMETKQLEIIQKVDNDGDGTLDMILFQPKVAPNGESKFEIIKVGEGENIYDTHEDQVRKTHECHV